MAPDDTSGGLDQVNAASSGATRAPSTGRDRSGRARTVLRCGAVRRRGSREPRRAELRPRGPKTRGSNEAEPPRAAGTVAAIRVDMYSEPLHAIRFVAAALLFGSGCFLPDQPYRLDAGISDGEACDDSEACASMSCVSGVCVGSSCTCDGRDCPDTGAPSDDCEEGWACFHYSGDDFFFGAYSGNQCRPPCGACPEHWTCYDDYDLFCTPDPTWRAPIVTVSATPQLVAPGGKVTLAASAESPVGDTELTFAWQLYDGTSSAAPSFEHVYPTSGVYHESVTVSAPSRGSPPPPPST